MSRFEAKDSAADILGPAPKSPPMTSRAIVVIVSVQTMQLNAMIEPGTPTAKRQENRVDHVLRFTLPFRL